MVVGLVGPAVKPCIAIAHAAWSPGRAETLARLIAELEPQGVKPYVQVSEQKEHAQVWARRLWAWAAQQEGPAILLNDDVWVSPDLVARVDAMTDILPDEILSLHCQLPAARELAEAGVTWLRSYWASGPAMVIPKSVSPQLEEWMAKMPKSLLGKWNEDGYLQLWAWSRRRPMFHCLPALVQHDVDVPSSLGYDKHTLRSAVVDWRDSLYAEDGLPEVRLDGPAPFVENPWMTTDTLMWMEAVMDGLMAKGLCVMCQKTPIKFTSHISGCGVCGPCVAQCVTAAVGA